MKSTIPPPVPAHVPLGSIAAMVRALPNNQPSPAFRDAAVAILRLSRARGRVECDALGSVFEDEDISDDRRILILDLLGSAGTPEAQVVMRRLLALSVARRNSRTFASFVQRLGFVEHPDVPTLRYLMNVYAESRNEAHEVRAACAYTLGAAAGRAHVWGLQDAALRAANTIRRDLMVATTPAEKCALVTALGNAGLDDDVTVIVGFVDDPDTRVRSAAALGLRKMHTTESKNALLTILSGSDHTVAESALSALFGQSLDLDELIRLAQLVLSGRTALSLDGRILRLMVTQKLGALPSGMGCPVVEGAIHHLLTRLESAVPHGGGSADGQTTQVNESGAYVRFAAAAEHAQRAAEALAPAPLGAPPIATMPATMPSVVQDLLSASDASDASNGPPATAAPKTAPVRHRPRMIAIPKLPLPYSAHYRMVSDERERERDRSDETARSPIRTVMQGSSSSASAALRAATPSPQSVSGERLVSSMLAPEEKTARMEKPAVVIPKREMRSSSAYTISSPIVPFARIG